MNRALGMFSIRESIIVAFRSAKVAAFAERKATHAEVILRSILILICALMSFAAAAAAGEPLDIAAYFVTPEQDSVLRWKAAAGESPEYTIRDYWGKSIATGQAKVAEDGVAAATVKLPRGLYEIELPATKQRLGVVSLPPYAGKPDPFLCIDSALSWLVRDDRLREGLVRDLRRSGIAMSRERLSWGEVVPAEGKTNWEGSHRFDTLRRTYSQQGVEILEMFHDSPGWTGNVGKYPADLVATARVWREIARHWRPTWGALEVWNEPDIFFGGDLPADQYVPLVRMMAYALQSRPNAPPLVGGVFAVYNRPYLDTAARNGMLDCADAVSFHTYYHAPEMEKLIENYRSWLRAYQREAMPLWITECGQPWPKGPDRPPLNQDALSAADITMKAVEAKVGGIARYFAFVYPFYEENQHNFGMMDRHGTPLRSMAAYAQLALVLAGKQYLGDLRCDDAAVQRARVLGDGRETLVVLYTGKPQADAKVKLGLPAARIEGIDGRRLEAAEDGSIPVPDGLTYVWLDREKIGERLRTDTPVMKLWRIGRQQPPPRPAPSPIVLRFQADLNLLKASAAGYRLPAESLEKVRLVVRAFNLAGEPHEVTLMPSFLDTKVAIEEPPQRSVTVPTEGFADASWEVDLSEAFSAADRLRVTVAAADKSGAAVAPLDFELSRERPKAATPAKATQAAPTLRRFRLGFTAFPHDMTLEAVQYTERFMHENADLIAVHLEGVPWVEAIEEKPFHPKLMEDWQRLKRAAPPGGKVYLALTPLNNGRSDIAAYRAQQEGLPLPKSLVGKALDDPAVVDAYLKYCRRGIEFFKPDYLGVGIEVNELYHNAPAKWDAYRRLHQRVYETLKKEHPKLPIFASLTLHNMRNPGWRDRQQMLDAFKRLMPYNDVVAVSFYPFMAGLTGDVDGSLDWLAREFAPFKKPYAVVEMGQNAEPIELKSPPLKIAGDEATQRAVLDKTLAFARRERCEFVVWFVPRDYDGLWEKIRSTAPEFFKVWKDCGLIDGAGAPRPAHRIWQETLALPVEQ